MHARLLRRLLFDWGPALAYMALIWWMSSKRVQIQMGHFPWRDKGVHFLEYACLGGVLARATLSTWPHLVLRAAIAAAVATFCWGVLDELHQAFVPGRSPDAADLVADALGATVGVFAFWLLWSRYHAWRSSHPEGR